MGLFEQTYVAFSPSGRYACRLGQRQDQQFDGTNFSFDYYYSFHFVDFETEAYYDISLGKIQFCVLHFYWLDNEHIVVVRNHLNPDDENHYQIKSLLYKFDADARKLHALDTIVRDIYEFITGPDTFVFCEGFLTINGQEKDISLKPEEYVLTAQNNFLYVVLPGVHILAINIDKYFKLLELTKNPPDYSDFCSKIVIPSPGLRPFRSFVQNDCVFLLLKGQSDKYYLRICDLNTEQQTGIYEIEEELEEKLFFASRSRNLFVHPSGQLVQFQTDNLKHETDSEVIKGQRIFNLINRQTNMIKFVNKTPVPTEMEQARDLVSEEELLIKCRDDSKLPLCLKEGRSLLTLPIECTGVDQ